MCNLLLKSMRHANIKERIGFAIIVCMVSVLFAGQALAINLQLLGKPLALKGYINQSVQFGVAGDKYDTMTGIQQALTQALLEVEYFASYELKMFASGQLVKDWAYDINDSDEDWDFKRFDESRSELSLRNDYEDMLKECHVTWTPGDFNIRIGKQIVVWGRMDGVRIMDQINPKDVRLGPSDVEFETSIIPIWLAKMEYYPQVMLPFVDEFALEFTFNPNVDFIGDKAPATGNNEHGVWTANNLIPQLNGRVGALITDYEKPDEWSDGHEYAVRIKGTLQDSTYVTLNFFDGVDDNPIFMPDSTKGLLGLNLTGIFDDKGRQIYEPYMKGYYPDKRYAGFTMAKGLDSLYIEALGGVAPMLRCEALYEFDSAFTHNDASSIIPVYRFEEHDAIYWGIGLDWKFKWRLLNPRRYFSIVPQFSHRYIKDYPSAPGTYLQTTGGLVVAENNYSFSIRMDTWYLHDKLQPFVYYQRDIRQDVDGIIKGSVKSDLWLFKLTYQPNHIWTFQTQLTLMENDGYDLEKGMGNKDNISFTVKYQF